MDASKKRLRDLEARAYEAAFAPIAEMGPPYDGKLRALAARMDGRRGWSYKSLERKFREYLRSGTMLRKYYGSESEQINPPIDWRGWKREEIAAALKLAGLTQAEWALANGETGAAVSYVLGDKKRSRGSQKAADKLAEWAEKFLAERLRKIRAHRGNAARKKA